jgi:hypothetical protein
MARAREILAARTPGDAAGLTAGHRQRSAPGPQFRLLAPELGGGALPDPGLYPASFASLMPGGPARITAVSHPALTGADATTPMIFQYDRGARAAPATTSRAASGTPAAINGTAARIQTDGWSYAPAAFRVIARDGTEPERLEEPHEGRGRRGQPAPAGRCLRAGLPESPLLPPDETHTITQATGEARRADRLVPPASLTAPRHQAHHIPAVPAPAARTTPGASAASLPRYAATPRRTRPAPGPAPPRTRSGHEDAPTPSPNVT